MFGLIMQICSKPASVRSFFFHMAKTCNFNFNLSVTFKFPKRCQLNWLQFVSYFQIFKTLSIKLVNCFFLQIFKTCFIKLVNCFFFFKFSKPVQLNWSIAFSIFKLWSLMSVFGLLSHLIVYWVKKLILNFIDLFKLYKHD